MIMGLVLDLGVDPKINSPPTPHFGEVKCGRQERLPVRASAGLPTRVPRGDLRPPY
jgi:hypothetical protein